MTLILEPETATKVWRKKRSQSKTAEVRQICFTRLDVLKYPFIPTNPLLAAMRFFCLFLLFFPFFFFLNLVRSSSPKPQNMEI